MVDIWWDIGRETLLERSAVDLAVSDDVPSSVRLDVVPVGLGHHRRLRRHVGSDHLVAELESLPTWGTALTAEDARIKLKSLASPAAATAATRFFKTGPGEYGEGDTFIGVNVPTLRTVSRGYRSMPLAEAEALLHSTVHEERHLALLILVIQVAKGDEAHRKRSFDLYLRNTQFVNNWDLVDCSAPQVVGGYLMNKPKKPLMTLAKSESLWERRIAVVSTQHFVRHGMFEDTLAVSELLLRDEQDLIHKATGWTLREVGKKDQSVLEEFLDRHAAVMPRTMLRYALEKFPPDRRRAYLQMKPN